MRTKALCTFYPELYIGDSVKGVTRIKWRLKHGSGQFSIWCVLSAPWTNERLAIIHSAFLQQPAMREHPAKVYGIATSKAEAKKLIVRISEDASGAGMEGRLKGYLDSRW